MTDEKDTGANENQITFPSGQTLDMSAWNKMANEISQTVICDMLLTASKEEDHFESYTAGLKSLVDSLANGGYGVHFPPRDVEFIVMKITPAVNFVAEPLQWIYRELIARHVQPVFPDGNIPYQPTSQQFDCCGNHRVVAGGTAREAESYYCPAFAVDEDGNPEYVALTQCWTGAINPEAAEGVYALVRVGDLEEKAGAYDFLRGEKCPHDRQRCSADYCPENKEKTDEPANKPTE